MMRRKRTIGFWVIMTIGVLFLIMLVLGQMMAFINYDFTVSTGLQESKDVVGELGVAVNKGFGVGDTIVYAPILLIGLIGLWHKKMWGVFAMFGALAITAYWPMLTLFFLLYGLDVPGFHFSSVGLYSMFLVPITIYGFWGLLYLYRNRNRLAET